MRFLRSQSPRRKEVLAGTVVLRRDIPDLLTPEFSAALSLWSDYKRFGLPYAGGWAEQPAHIVSLLRLFDAEFTAWQESKNGSRGTKANSQSRSR